MSAPSQAQTATSNQLVLESSTMDLKADPCTQFFEYANGLWLKNNPIPDRSRYSAFDEVTERNMIALKKSRKQRRRVTINTRAAQLVGAFYASGMNEAQIEKEAYVHWMQHWRKLTLSVISSSLFP
jgi:putative endopeptidase